MHFPASDPIHKATIIPRGRALGMVMRLPEADRISFYRNKMIAQMTMSMGGRVAEELVFGYDRVSSGASGDIEMATKLASAMVNHWGLSDELGPVLYGPASDSGQGILRSQESAAKSDEQIKLLVKTAHAEATRILTEHRDQLNTVAEALIEYETLTGDEIKQLMAGEKIARPDPAASAPKPIRSKLPSSKKMEETVSGE
jgi:cell division protease FtsH